MNARDLKVKAYCNQSALTAEASITTSGIHTLSLDVARGAKPTFDWKSKLTVQITEDELPMVLGVLLGWVGKMEGRHHGQQHNKGYSLEHQGTHVFLVVTQQGKGAIAVRIDGAPLLGLSGLILHQMQQNMPWLSTDTILSLTKATIGRLHQTVTPRVPVSKAS